MSADIITVLIFCLHRRHFSMKNHAHPPEGHVSFLTCYNVGRHYNCADFFVCIADIFRVACYKNRKRKDVQNG
ncbi:hypothetical protein DWZ56_17610 [Lachnotalea sp. AF33-28]|nr:hypothetical protein DWZ56_17610 [Lachnotalea sp. AF33-28]